ncbi:MAG: TIGR04283 family arsenosugar biosynthesis glycosyltransferase [Gammaproteobacteria bacterium]|jgi:rSAM/selenodomain-associated transferase 2|nr:TIGR04283 family arsenosugar biosynthesis glycosyltransferase [Gammaproteobacteria bacterium]
MKLSIIIPVYNEAENIVALLRRLQNYRFQGHEVIVIDGGSRDNSFDCAVGMVDKLLMSKPGRAMQMNIGAEQASGEVLVFLHADTELPPQANNLIIDAMNKKHQWGRFNVRLSGQHRFFRVIETMMNWRSCITGIATGDQAIFVRRKVFQQAGGYPEIMLMDDIELSKKLKAFGKPACIKRRVTTSSRRWEKIGIVKTTLLMWQLRLLHFLGVSPDKLFTRYAGK